MNTHKDDDFEEIADASKLDIPSLPVIAARVLDMLSEEMLNADDLAEVISFDPAFTSRVLKVANSPYFCRGDKVSSIDEAIMNMGFEAVSDIVVMSALKDLRRGSDAIDEGLWEHSTAVAVASRLIAVQLGAGRLGEHFIHGLLHDIGKMVMNINFKEKYAAVIDEVRSAAKPFEEVEFAAFGFSHCGIGDYVAKKWRMPVEIRSVISMHHLTASDIADNEHAFDVLLVKAANYVCSELKIGIGDNYGFIEKDLAFIGLTKSAQIERLMEKVEEEYPKYKSFMLKK
ncbi:MAG: HDOD domain-containing protein [Nitrospirae bacterium]|nr:HDOD domain-containing protein [Nitrospirota bacterium]